jgi:hypothetical protein
LPNGRIPLREPPCPGRQVGEGVGPTLDAITYIIAGVYISSDLAEKFPASSNICGWIFSHLAF